MEQKEIRAVYDHETIRVYQAFNREIAQEAVRLGTFGSHFKTDRMTWIKPSFLWMMYRCGWGTKENQEHILAIDMRQEGFDYLVKNAVPSSFSEELEVSREEWKQAVSASAVRVQWDPEKDIYGNSLAYRSIQLGLRGEAVRKYITEWIVRVQDITKEAAQLRARRDAGEDITPLLPQEKVYRNDRVWK